MINRQGGTAGVALIILLIILLGVSLYFLYLNLPTDPVALKIINSVGRDVIPIEPNYSSSGQFYENMRFKDRRISYKIEAACDADKVSDVREAISILDIRTILDFYPSLSNPEIIITCSEIEPNPENEGYFVVGEGGPTEVINTSLYAVILSGKASFFREEKCDKPNVAIHELLHVLGFDHNSNPNSILYPTLDCDQTIDQSIIDDINSLYSVKSAPDLKLVNVDATKSGRYIDFDIEVINQGLQDTEDVKLSVYSDGEFVKEFDLGEINIGTRKFLEVTNLKISRRDTNIKFIVDDGNEISEILENNNDVELILIEG